LACARWGRQKRRIWVGGDWYVDGEGLRRHHADGYAQSFLGRLLEERDGTGQGARNQHWPEVLWGDALEVQIALTGMPVICYDVLHLHFVFDPEFGLTAARKAELAQISRRSYWDVLQLAELRVWGRLAPGQVREAMDLPVIEWRPRVIVAPKFRGPRLLFRALRRPLLRLDSGEN
jgi:hypothetical protein